MVQPGNRFAYKEWAAICAALRSGRQTILLRKGGIDEGQAGFRVAHQEFWLFPTFVHQQADGLEPDALPLLEQAERERPAEGTLRIDLYATVTEVLELASESQALALAGQHVWSPRTVSERFHYRRPGLFLLAVRIYELRAPRFIPDSPHFAGCRTWVDLPDDLPTAEFTPVLGDEEFARRLAACRRAVAETAVT